MDNFRHTLTLKWKKLMKPLNKLRDIEYKAYTLKYYKKSSV